MNITYINLCILFEITVLILMKCLKYEKCKKFAKNIVKFIKKKVLGIFLIFESVFSLLFFAFSYVVPKKKDLVLFMGRNYSGFLDNIKYMMIYLHDRGLDKKYKIVFVGCKDNVVDRLKDKGFNAISYYRFTPKVYALLLRAKVIISDNAHWTTNNRYIAAFKAHKIQLWHGIGFKKIRLTDPKFANKAAGIKGFFTYKLQGQLAIYDLFLSTSDFYTKEVFYPSFYPREFFISGYPRNDVFLNEKEFSEDLVLINADEDVFFKVKRLYRKGTKFVLYAPTFRKAKRYNIDKNNLDFERLSSFGEKNNIYFIFKLHPLPSYSIDFSQYSHILEYNNRSDVYPIFKYISLLITDYSSIYMDYLLLDRPILFYQYDYYYYTNSCRDIREDFMELSPGEKCFTQEELFASLREILVEGKDQWKEERKRIRNLSWKYQGGQSCKLIWDYIEGRYLK